MNLRIKIPDHREKNALRKLHRELSRVLRRTVGDFGPRLIYGGPTLHGVDVEVSDSAQNPWYRFMPDGRSMRGGGSNKRQYPSWEAAINDLLCDSIAACYFVRSQAGDIVSHFSDLHRVWNNRPGRTRPRRADRQRRAA